MNKTQVILFGSIGIVIVLAILLILGVIPGLKQNVSSASADMLLWDFGSSPEIWTQTIGVYKAANPNINITYVQKDPNRFEEELLNALASGKAPDIWTIKQSWILKHKDKIFPFPEVSLQFSKTDYQRLFADTSFSFIQDKQIIALPTSIDTLALFYNKDIFNSENIPNPPSTWDDMLAVVKKTTKRSAVGNIIQGGVAMGTIKNINHGVDVVSALLLQNGNSILDPESKTSDLGNQESSNAIEFYRSFSDSGKKNYSWSDEMPSSLDAFAEEKVSMAFGFSTDYPLIKAKNPRLNFAIAALPQQNDSTIKTNYGVTTGLTVSRNSKNPLEAWRFILYATTDPTAIKFYLNGTGKPPAYRPYVNADILPPYGEVFQKQVLSAKSWLQPDEDKVSSVFQNMIQSARGNASSINQVADSAAGQLEQMLVP